MTSSKQYKATIIGDGEMSVELVNLIKNYQLSGMVTMQGAQSQESIRNAMDCADIFLMPGIELQGNVEAQGLVIQEAQAMELPVLVSEAGGMPEGIEDNVTGYVIKQNDIDGFCGKIEMLAEKAAMRKQMGEAGRQLAVEKFDTHNLNEQLISLYNKN